MNIAKGFERVADKCMGHGEAAPVTIIEYRENDGKLNQAWYDEGLVYIENAIYALYEGGASEFSVLANPREFDLSFIEHF